MSHELRTPINSVMIGIDILCKELRSLKNNIEISEILNDMKRSCRISIDLLNDMMQFDKLDKGILFLERVHVSASDLLRETISLYEVTVSETFHYKLNK